MSVTRAVRIVLASRNPGKLRELRDAMQWPADVVEWLLLPDVAPGLRVEEDGESFEENARKKAMEAARVTGLPALADDSGLEVVALGGAPGVRSARFAGPEASDASNNRELLRRLRRVPAALRGARFRCVLAFALPGSRATDVWLAEGVCEGAILQAPRGAGGFGYDPLFVPEGEQRTFAELGLEGKRRFSHRVRAIERMRPRLSDWIEAMRHAGMET